MTFGKPTYPPKGHKAVDAFLGAKEGLLNSKTGVVPITSTAPIQVMRWARNGKHPNAILESMKAMALNQAIMHRTKEVFSQACSIQDPEIISTRWRFAFHTGPYTRYVRVIVVGEAAPSTTVNAYCTLDLNYGTAPGTTVTEQFDFGADGLGRPIGAWGLDLGGLKEKTIQVEPDTSYTGVFTDHSNAFTSAACVYEMSSMTEHLGGYFAQNVAAGGPITGASQRIVAETIRAQWLRGGAHLFNWSCDDGTKFIRTSSGTPKNIIDNETEGWSILGPVWDLTGCARRSENGQVPVRIAAYGKDSGGPDDGTAVRVYDSAGTILLEAARFETSAGWVYGDGYLPATLDTYNVMFVCEANTDFDFGAVSIYMYDP